MKQKVGCNYRFNSHSSQHTFINTTTIWYCVTKKKRTPAQKRAIKKAQRVWDEMHFSRAEGKVPEILATNGDIFKLVGGSVGACSKARNIADDLREDGYKARVKDLTIKGKDTCMVYKGPKRKTEWTGYGERERGGLGRNR